MVLDYSNGCFYNDFYRNFFVNLRFQQFTITMTSFLRYHLIKLIAQLIFPDSSLHLVRRIPNRIIFGAFQSI